MRMQRRLEAKFIALQTFLLTVVQVCSAQVLSPSFVARMDFPVGQQPVAIATGDFNGDGKLDIVTANGSSNDVSVLLGNGDGTFQTAIDYPVDAQPGVVIVGDFNNDGKPDILTGNQVSISLGCAVC